jgi:hypothetical protein
MVVDGVVDFTRRLADLKSSHDFSRFNS